MYKNPPGNINDLRRRVADFAGANNIIVKQIQNELGNSILAQMLPGGVVIKGGGSLALRYPPKEVRYTSDLDLVYKQSLDEFMSNFKENLEVGWGNFKGNLIDRGETESINMPYDKKMTPLNVKLTYKDKPFMTVEIDAVSQVFDEVDSAQIVRNSLGNSLFEEIVLPIPADSKLMSLENQLAQKIQALANPNQERSHDLIDIQTILTMDRENIDFKKFSVCLRREFKLNKINYPLNIEQISNINKSGYNILLAENPGKLPFEEALKIVDDITNKGFDTENTKMPKNIGTVFVKLDSHHRVHRGTSSQNPASQIKSQSHRLG
jgi:hypothetical protein